MLPIHLYAKNVPYLLIIEESIADHTERNK